MIQDLPPVPFRSSSTLSLSGVAFLNSTNRVELPGLSVADNSFMKCSLNPDIGERAGSSTCRGIYEDGCFLLHLTLTIAAGFWLID
jgi:hypothetical protein